MKKLLTAFVFILSFSFILTSCGNYNSKYDYRWGNDGLIYNINNDKLFTGNVRDTSNVIIEFQVVNGKKNGLFESYYLDGQIEKSGFILNDNNEGLWEYYYPNGQLESEGNFDNNLPEGKWISYYSNGNKKCEGSYKQGKQDKVWIYYDGEGNVINMIIYEDGKFVDIQNRFS